MWAQTFSFDPFGNITKTGSSSWACATCYDTSTNHYNSTLSNQISYDSDGNLKNDTFHTYQWDANGHPTVIDSTSNQTYDALGNMVELSQPGWLAQYLYDENGYELGEDQGITGNTFAFIPLPGGGTALYDNGSLENYGHADWLGSSRLTSGSTQSFVGDEARAPYGEKYAAQEGHNTLGFFAGLGQNLFADLYDTHFREYHPTQGRWITPDPAGAAAVDPSNPQTWNRYAYVANNPLSFIYPTGLNRMRPGECDSNLMDCSGGAGLGGGVWEWAVSGYGEGNFWTVLLGGWIDFGGGGQDWTTDPMGGSCEDSSGTAGGFDAVAKAIRRGGQSHQPSVNSCSTVRFIQQLQSFNQTVSDCYNGSHTTAAGKATEFFSALSWLPIDNNWQSNIRDTATFGLAKGSTVGLVSRFGSGLWQTGAKAIEGGATAVFATATALDSLVFGGCVGAGVNAATAPSEPQ